MKAGHAMREVRGERTIWAAAIGLALVLVAGVYAGLSLLPEEGLTIEGIKTTVLGWGKWGVVGSMALMVIHSFVPFPAELVACANGMLYGPVWGTVITWSGAMLGAFTAFGISRWLGRPFVNRMIAAKQWHYVDDWAAREGWQVLLVSRFTPVIAFNLVNYAAGLTGISWWTFTWTTGIGILPMTAIMVVLGDNLERLPWWSWALLLASGLLVWLVLQRLVRRGQTHEGPSGS